MGFTPHHPPPSDHLDLRTDPSNILRIQNLPKAKRAQHKKNASSQPHPQSTHSWIQDETVSQEHLDALVEVHVVVVAEVAVDLRPRGDPLVAQRAHGGQARVLGLHEESDGAGEEGLKGGGLKGGEGRSGHDVVVRQVAVDAGVRHLQNHHHFTSLYFDNNLQSRS